MFPYATSTCTQLHFHSVLVLDRSWAWRSVHGGHRYLKLFFHAPTHVAGLERAPLASQKGLCAQPGKRQRSELGRSFAPSRVCERVTTVCVPLPSGLWRTPT